MANPWQRHRAERQPALELSGARQFCRASIRDLDYSNVDRRRGRRKRDFRRSSPARRRRRGRRCIAQVTLTVSPGDVLTIQSGSGGTTGTGTEPTPSWVSTTPFPPGGPGSGCLAAAGNNSGPGIADGGAGALLSACVGDIAYPGGDGADGVAYSAGEGPSGSGGGGAGSLTGSGASGIAGTAAAFMGPPGTGGYLGGANGAGDVGGVNTPATLPSFGGGGGGGGYDSGGGIGAEQWRRRLGVDRMERDGAGQSVYRNVRILGRPRAQVAEARRQVPAPGPGGADRVGRAAQ